MRFPLSLSFFLLFLVGCSCSTTPAPSDGGGGTDASTADAPEIPDAGCPDRVTAVIGPEGGELSHCEGGRLVVEPGVLTAPVEYEIDRLRDAPPPGSPLVFAGAPYRFGPAATPGPVRIELPHDGSAPILIASLVDATTWETFEACEVTDTHISQTVFGLGTFAALTDPTPSPSDRTGLGSGTITYTFDGATDTLDIDPQGYAIDEAASPDFRSLTLVFVRSDAGALVQVDLRFTIDDTGVVSPVSIARADTSVSEIWGADILGFPGDLTVTLTSDDGTAIEGTVEATLHLGDMTRPFTATFSASSEFFRYPPELVCSGAGG